MRTVGIIAEYNPFHTGHEYHIRRARELAGADYVVVVMSPDYVQRGTPAIFDKYTRTAMALHCGADLVLELPVCYAAGSAEYFAEGAISLLNGLGVIDALCFGVEATDSSEALDESSGPPDAGIFQAVAQILLDEPMSYRTALREGLRRGNTFPLARADAVNRYIRSDVFEAARRSGMTEKQLSEIPDLLSSPNNILGVEYCKALIKFHSGITPLPLTRKGSAHLDRNLSGYFCSASAIRACLEEERAEVSLRQLRGYIPETIYPIFSEAAASPIFPDDLLPILMQKLIYMEHLETIFDVSQDLAQRISRLRYQCVGKSFHEITDLLKTRQITETHVRRALLHVILDIRKETVEACLRGEIVYYAHILGFRKTAEPLLHEIKRKSTLPLIAKAAHAPKQLSDAGLRMWSQDMAASHLYRAIRAERYGMLFKTEQETSPVIV